jgi:hypothetical protein
VAEIEFLRIVGRGKATRSASAYLYSFISSQLPHEGFGEEKRKSKHMKVWGERRPSALNGVGHYPALNCDSLDTNLVPPPSRRVRHTFH